MDSDKDTAMPTARAADASHSSPAVSTTGSIPIALTLDGAYQVVGEMLEYFDGYRLATWAPLASLIMREVERERAACALLAIQWRDENRIAAAKARKRSSRLHGSGFDDPAMGDMLDGAAIECNAIAQAIEARSDETGTGSAVGKSAVGLPMRPDTGQGYGK